MSRPIVDTLNDFAASEVAKGWGRKPGSSAGPDAKTVAAVVLGLLFAPLKSSEEMERFRALLDRLPEDLQLRMILAAVNNEAEYAELVEKLRYDGTLV